MKKNVFRRFFSNGLLLTLIAARLFSLSGCKKETPETPSVSTEKYQYTDIGEGGTEFLFLVTDDSGKQTAFKVSTDEETVGGALVKEGLISGEDSEFGLYIKTVNGVTLDFDKDGKYWAFYVNGSYAMSGVDATPIAEGELYEFRAE